MNNWFEMDSFSNGITAFSNTNSRQNVVLQPRNKQFVRTLRTSAGMRASDAHTLDKLGISSPIAADVSVLSEVGTTDVAARSSEKKKLLALVDQLVSDGFSCVRERSSNVSRASGDAAKALFSIILPSRRMPKIAPDGEGGLIAIWEENESATVLVIDDWRLHLVTAAATPTARYFDDLPFDGESVPDAIAEFVPR